MSSKSPRPLVEYPLKVRGFYSIYKLNQNVICIESYYHSTVTEQHKNVLIYILIFRNQILTWQPIHHLNLLTKLGTEIHVSNSEFLGMIFTCIHISRKLKEKNFPYLYYFLMGFPTKYGKLAHSLSCLRALAPSNLQA